MGGSRGDSKAGAPVTAVISRRRRALAAAATAAVLLGVTGCGTESSTLADNARTTLHQDVEQLREATADPAEAEAVLAQFRTHVNDLVAADALDAADALRLLEHAGRIETALPVPTERPAPAAVESPKAERVAATRTTSADDERAVEAWQDNAKKAWSKGNKGTKGAKKGKGRGND